MQTVHHATLPLDEIFALPNPQTVAALPELNADHLVQNIRRLNSLLEGMRPDLMRVPDVANLVEALQGMSRPPVWTVSTGRCGTLALDSWLGQSGQTTPFHRNMWFQQSRPLVDISIHRRRLAFWRLLTGVFDEASLWQDILYLAHLITPDLVEQARQGRSWIMTNHGVAPWAPYLLGLFPDLRVLHLRRRPEDTFNSCLWNGHWNNQIVPMTVRRVEASEGILIESLEDSMGTQIAFFLAATDVLGEAMMRSVPDSHGLFLKSESLYRAEPSSWEALTELTGIEDLPLAGFQANYSRKINSKAVRKFTPSEEYRADLDQRLRLLMSAYRGKTPTIEMGTAMAEHREWTAQWEASRAQRLGASVTPHAGVPAGAVPSPMERKGRMFSPDPVPASGSGQTPRLNLQLGNRSGSGAGGPDSRV